jgi:hypothetical protein
MGVPASEVGYTSATAGRGDHEVHKRHVVAFTLSINPRNIFIMYVVHTENIKA